MVLAEGGVQTLTCLLMAAVKIVSFCVRYIEIVVRSVYIQGLDKIIGTLPFLVLYLKFLFYPKY